MDTFTKEQRSKCISRIKSKAALFTSVIKSKALEHNINLDIKNKAKNQ